ncbi:trypsin-1-like [Chironomus tepperi]|uniref:trypsin-1-like n=1 Tax=Chironomus tepperi TaxID=113505 RepID=UPI00391F638F
MRILFILLILNISSFRSINTQFIFPDQFETEFPTSSPLPIFIKPNVKRLSELKCDEYSQKMTTYVGSLLLYPTLQLIDNDKCDRSQGLIIGGVNAKPGEFPHMAAVGIKEFNDIIFVCGGSLISDRFVLTAAHCKKAKGINATVVRLGEFNLKINEEPEQTIEIDQFIVHEHYDSKRKTNDIALVRLREFAVFGKYIRPACLLSDPILPTNKVVASGWGLTAINSFDNSDILQKVDLSLIRNDQCGRFLDDDYYLDDTQLCAGELEGGKDTCQGDSGGPLQIVSNKAKCIYSLVGITSFGRSCGLKNSPGIYTKVAAYIDWIEDKVWKS